MYQFYTVGSFSEKRMDGRTFLISGKNDFRSEFSEIPEKPEFRRNSDRNMQLSLRHDQSDSYDVHITFLLIVVVHDTCGWYCCRLYIIRYDLGCCLPKNQLRNEAC